MGKRLSIWCDYGTRRSKRRDIVPERTRRVIRLGQRLFHSYVVKAFGWEGEKFVVHLRLV